MKQVPHDKNLKKCATVIGGLGNFGVSGDGLGSAVGLTIWVTLFLDALASLKTRLDIKSFSY